ncbi:MAG: DUF4190 domain-containing protein [Ruminococcus sp.]|nr:DUF4190 domain-containing protein [Ruminococcus sp.]
MENNEETVLAEIPETVPAEETRDDLDDLPVKKDEELFFDNTDFQDYDEDENYHGGFLSVAAFVLSISSIVLVITGIFPLVIAGSVVALILGIIAVAGKHSEYGFAVGAVIISVIVIIICSWAYIDYPYFWGDKENKKFSIHADEEESDPGIISAFSVYGMEFTGGVD